MLGRTACDSDWIYTLQLNVSDPPRGICQCSTVNGLARRMGGLSLLPKTLGFWETRNKNAFAITSTGTMTESLRLYV